MIYLPFDIYPLMRPFVFLFDPETAHKLAILSLKWRLCPVKKLRADPVLRTTMGNMAFEHPLGLAAGFDKHAEIIPQLFELGFSSIELGGVTPLPQPGNPRPRMFRDAPSRSIINRYGFNSVGADVFEKRMKAYYAKKGKSPRRCIGINLGKNKNTENAVEDYVKGVLVFASLCDFLTINVSSPNTPGLRNLQEKESLKDILGQTLAARAKIGSKTPIFLKIAPDMGDAQLADIAEVSLSSGIDGLIVSNTTTSRPEALPSDYIKETGGLSGKPLSDMSTKLIGKMYALTQGKLPIIGCGGVFTGADAYAKIRAGATLVQVLTGMVFEGPSILSRIADELAALLKRDGFSSVNDAVGADHK